MIEYQLKDSDDNLYDINGDSVTLALKGSFTQGEDSFSYDNRIVERSFLSGSALIGDKRLMQKGFTLSFSSANSDSGLYRMEINTLLSFINKTVAIVDVTNDMEIKVTAETMNIGYDSGSLKHSSDNSIDFVALTPYWESLTADSENGIADADVIKEILVNNEGFLVAFPIITLIATVPTDDVQIYINSTNTGIQILDSSFGTAGNLTMIIDCSEGLVSINDLNRNVNIVPGTGFFEIPIGSDTINILSNETIDVAVEWQKRFFI